jgi:hypothetical protein
MDEEPLRSVKGSLAVNHARDNDLFFFNFIDNPVAVRKKLPHRRVLKFWNFSPRIWEALKLARLLDDLLYYGLCVSWGTEAI